MNPHRRSLFAIVALAFVAFVVSRVVLPITDAEVQAYWAASAKPYLSAHAAGWVAIVVDWLGPFWSGVAVTLLTLVVLEVVFTLTRKQIPAVLPEGTAERVKLRLRFTGERETPHATEEENVESWFAYWSPSAEVKTENGVPLFEVPPTWAIFIVFRKPVAYHQMTVGFTGGRPASYEVKQARDRSTVITLTGPMPACEMEAITRRM